MSEFNAKLLEELTLKLIKQNNVNFGSGAQFSIKCQFAQVENIVRDAIAEMKTKILDDLQSSFDTDMYYSDGGEALIDFESAKCAVEEHLNPIGEEQPIKKPELGVNCVIWCNGTPKIDRLTEENHFEAYWEESTYNYGEEEKFLILKED